MRLVLDLETTVVFKDNGKTDPSPYDPANKLVSVGYKVIETGETGYLFFHHIEILPFIVDWKDHKTKLQELLDKADCVIGHNLKFDMSWLYECGFKYGGALWDTMIFEYVAAKGQKPTLKLKDCAERYGLSPKMDTMGEYLKQGVNVDAIPMVELEEYGRADVETTAQLYELQRQRYKNEPDVKTMYPAIKLSNEALGVLIDIERAGVAIDVEELERVETEFRAEQVALQAKLKDMARAVIGDTPVNFASSADMSKLVYSMEVLDKDVWKDTFNIGTEQRGSVKKVKYNRRYKFSEFKDILRQQTKKVEATDIAHCTTCDGKGYIQKYKADKVKKKTGEVIKGEPYKKPNVCKDCNGAKVLYIPNGRVGGFRVKPISSEYATTNGFSTDKGTITDLLEQGDVSDDARIFLTSLARLNALDTYLTAFVGGIRNGIRADGVCHPNFNQCITATGRLSSSGPNFQNFPRGNTFPIRRVFISRWAKQGGVVIDTDFSGLEYITAVMLAECPAGLRSILEGKDRHELTANIMLDAFREDMDDEEWVLSRQEAKPNTFRPIYGGKGQTQKSQDYYEAFFEEHTGIKAWHEKICKEAIDTHQVVTPSGRIFAFPDAKRIDAERVQGKTQIVNYPVQSFATADISWCVFVELHRLMKEFKMLSKLVLQVHDSIVVDCHPDEIDTIQRLIVQAFSSARRLLTERFKYDTLVPIGFEVSMGSNLMNKVKVYKGSGIAVT